MTASVGGVTVRYGKAGRGQAWVRRGLVWGLYQEGKVDRLLQVGVTHRQRPDQIKMNLPTL